MSENLYCEDCKWFRRSWVFFWDTGMAKCASPETVKTVTGTIDRCVARKYNKPKKTRRYCTVARISPCGEGAKYWEGK